MFVINARRNAYCAYIYFESCAGLAFLHEREFRCSKRPNSHQGAVNRTDMDVYKRGHNDTMLQPNIAFNRTASTFFFFGSFFFPTMNMELMRSANALSEDRCTKRRQQQKKNAFLNLTETLTVPDWFHRTKIGWLWLGMVFAKRYLLMIHSFFPLLLFFIPFSTSFDCVPIHQEQQQWQSYRIFFFFRS